MSVYAVIPAFNEAATIRRVTTGALRYVEGVIVVDDGSTDATSETVADVPGVILLRHPSNAGKAAALLTGFAEALTAGADAIITLDGDGQHQAEDIPRLLAFHDADPDALVIAARTRKRSLSPALRRMANLTADFWISWAAGTLIHDSQSGFRIYPAALLRPLPEPPPRRDAFTFETAMLIDAAHRQCPLAFVDIDTFYFAGQRRSHYRNYDTWRIVVYVAGQLLHQSMNLPGLPIALRRFWRRRPPQAGGDHALPGAHR